jgi:Na+/proline symporter
MLLLFRILAINLKAVAHSAHTKCEIARARWGKTAHLPFLFFGFCSSIIITSMLLLGGTTTVEILTSKNYALASFLIPWGIILHTAVGGLKAICMASYLHTMTIIFAVVACMITIMHIKVYSSDMMYQYLNQTVSYTEEQCTNIFSKDGAGKNSFNRNADGKKMMVCGLVEGNIQKSYLSMISSGGLMFGIINIIGNFGMVFEDQSYWQATVVAARPESAAEGYLLGGVCWFAVPFSLATSLGLASTTLMLPITSDKSSSRLPPPAVADYLMGNTGAVLILTVLYMTIVSTGSAESIAVSSLVAYDIYREYINPNATDKQILYFSRLVIVVFNVVMGLLVVSRSV